MSNQLIPVFTGEISGALTQLVDAALLHKFVESKQDFSTWIKKRIVDYEFTQGIDFIIPQKNGSQESITYGKDRIDYHLTLDMAKELGMVERNEKGREIRKYFIEVEKKAKAQYGLKDAKRTLDPTKLTKTNRAFIALAKLNGLKGNQAILTADKATAKIEGYSPLELLGIELTTDIKQKTLTPTEIGLQIGGISAIKVNKLLEEAGYQNMLRDSHNNPIWEPTKKGICFGEMLDTHKKHGDGTPVKQWKWYSTIIDEIATTEAA